MTPLNVVRLDLALDAATFDAALAAAPEVRLTVFAGGSAGIYLMDSDATDR